MPILPRPWCTKDPRPCIVVLGIAEILLSVTGLIVLVSLPIILLQLDHEVDYIKRQLLTDADSPFNRPTGNELYTLNITETYGYICDEVLTSIKAYLDQFLRDKLYHESSIIRQEIIRDTDENGVPSLPEHLCEIHVQSKQHPMKKIVGFKNSTLEIHYSIMNIVSECVSQFTQGDKEEIEKEKMFITLPNRDKIAKQHEYPWPVGNDPERIDCINVRMRDAGKDEVLEKQDLLYTYLIASAGCALIAGFALTSTGFTVSRPAMMFTFLLQFASIGAMAGGILTINDPHLCLFQYGGISAFARDTPGHMQTIITYICTAYIVSFKLYCLWSIMAYAENAPSIKRLKRKTFWSPDYSEYVADIAWEVSKRNRMLAERSTDDDDYDETDPSSDEYNNRNKNNNDNKIKPPEKGKDKTLVVPFSATSSNVSQMPAAVGLGNKSPNSLRPPPYVPPAKKFKHATLSPKPFDDDDDQNDSDSDSSGGGGAQKGVGVGGANNAKDGGGSRRRRGERGNFSGNTLVPHKRDKVLFANNFFGNN